MRALRYMIPGLAGLSLTTCDPGVPCDDNAECTKGAKCWCDGQRRLVVEERDANGDKIVDRIRFTRDGRGRVTIIESDWSNNGSVERRQEYGYDAEDRRVSSEGWLAQCAGQKFHWSCRYEEACPPPYQRCAPCRNKYEIEKQHGSFEPCGKQAK